MWLPVDVNGLTWGSDAFTVMEESSKIGRNAVRGHLHGADHLLEAKVSFIRPQRGFILANGNGKGGFV